MKRAIADVLYEIFNHGMYFALQAFVPNQTEKYFETKGAYSLGQVLRRYGSWVEEVAEESSVLKGKCGAEAQHYTRQIRNQLRLYFFRDGLDPCVLEKIDFFTGVVLLASYEWSDHLQSEQFLTFSQNFQTTSVIAGQEKILRQARSHLVAQMMVKSNLRSSLQIFLTTLVTQLQLLPQSSLPGDFEIGSTFLRQLNVSMSS